MTCTVTGCDRPVRARGMCARHYTDLPRPLPCVHGDCTKPAVTRTGLCADHGNPPGCQVDGCDRKGQAGGYCERHWKRIKVHGDPLAHIPIGQLQRWGKKQCSDPGCDRAAIQRGMCRKHYQKARRAGQFAPAECLTCVDAEWLIGSGETPENVVTRLGVSTRQGLDSALDSVRVHLRRHGRRDLAARLSRERSYV